MQDVIVAFNLSNITRTFAAVITIYEEHFMRCIIGVDQLGCLCQ
jgi:hypothetical protein